MLGVECIIRDYRGCFIYALFMLYLCFIYILLIDYNERVIREGLCFVLCFVEVRY